ncbi:hypothetical protein KC19_10G038600 [Ceratodon purpureus]|uniref:Uncharacterized protein n=1 Tax=Ceratodon purpureus TaxID=3225 RepID=A0A8T0GK55_CERPU|nr:hypothetical protein KC19_10G038600 [Ceratodon purpureus]
MVGKGGAGLEFRTFYQPSKVTLMRMKTQLNPSTSKYLALVSRMHSGSCCKSFGRIQRGHMGSKNLEIFLCEGFIP